MWLRAQTLCIGHLGLYFPTSSHTSSVNCGELVSLSIPQVSLSVKWDTDNIYFTKYTGLSRELLYILKQAEECLMHCNWLEMLTVIVVFHYKCD